MLTYVHYTRLVDLLYNLIYTAMQTKLQVRHVRRSQELRQRTGITYITSYFFLRPTISPEKFVNGVLTLKTHQIFSVHATLEEFENAGHLCLRKHRAGKSRVYRDVIVKAPFTKCFLSTRKRKSGVVKFPLFHDRFRVD